MTRHARRARLAAESGTHRQPRSPVPLDGRRWRHEAGAPGDGRDLCCFNQAAPAWRHARGRLPACLPGWLPARRSRPATVALDLCHVQHDARCRLPVAARAAACLSTHARPPACHCLPYAVGVQRQGLGLGERSLSKFLGARVRHARSRARRAPPRPGCVRLKKRQAGCA